jgi:hypothetical protein
MASCAPVVNRRSTIRFPESSLRILVSAQRLPDNWPRQNQQTVYFQIVTIVLTNRPNRAISPVTDFENKFIPSPFNNLQPIPGLAAPAFCAALFYPEFANEYYRQKTARQLGLPARGSTSVAGNIAKNFHKQS